MSLMESVENRKSPVDMTEREMLEELVYAARELEKGIIAVSKNPMLKAMMPKG